MGTIYAASASIWVFMVLSSTLELVYHVASGTPSRAAMSRITAFALVGAVLLTGLGAMALKGQYGARAARMDRLAGVAMAIVVRDGLEKASRNPVFHTACGALLEDAPGVSPDDIRGGDHAGPCRTGSTACRSNTQARRILCRPQA
jgi:hypothetical protein